MATKTLTSRIILRNDTANNWTTNNPVLLKGEIGLETDTGKYKIGDGTSNWQALQYYVNLDQDSKTSLDTLIEMLDDDNFGKVNDVQVNGTTVVENKVANVSIGVLTTATTAQSEVTSGESFTNNIVLHKVAKTGNYNDLLNKLNVVDNLNSTSTTDVLSANQGSVLKSMVQALPSAKSFTNIQAMITALNGYSNTEMNVGTSIYLQQTDVPDFWVYSKADSSVAYTYTDDSAFISAVETSGYVQVGYYNIAMLETAKVDLTDYYTKTDTDSVINTINANIDNIINNTTKIAAANGGFSAGTNARAHAGGGAIGNGAFTNGGGAIGNGANTNVGSGGAVGRNATADNGGAVGANADGGDGFAGGQNSKCTWGGAVGYGTNTTIGFAGGQMAKAQDADGNGINAIQLGQGTNSDPKSLQIYTYKLMTAEGKVPDERLNDTVLFSEDVLILDGGTSTVTTTMEG